MKQDESISHKALIQHPINSIVKKNDPLPAVVKNQQICETSFSNNHVKNSYVLKINKLINNRAS